MDESESVYDYTENLRPSHGRFEHSLGLPCVRARFHEGTLNSQDMEQYYTSNPINLWHSNAPLTLYTHPSRRTSL